MGCYLKMDVQVVLSYIISKILHDDYQYPQSLYPKKLCKIKSMIEQWQNS